MSTPSRIAVVGTLKGFDPLVNLVLDDCVEFLRGGSAASLHAWQRPRMRAPRPSALSYGRCVHFRRLAGRADPSDPYKLTETTRSLGLVVCRGPTVMLVCPMDGYKETENPFLQEEE